MSDAQKRCLGCGAEKPLDDFGWDLRTRDDRRRYCDDCHLARSAVRAPGGPGSSRHYHLVHRFGIGVEDFDRILESQSGLCACCSEAPGSQVDHDHQTGAVRGILCLPCNALLGAFRDEERLLYAAVDYIAAARGEPWTDLVET